jgi:hypothetical protein
LRKILINRPKGHLEAAIYGCPEGTLGTAEAIALFAGCFRRSNHPAVGVVCSFVLPAADLPQNSQNRKCVDLATQIALIL